MTRCDWAGCSNPGDMQDHEGWWHCAEHWRTHQALELEAAGVTGRTDSNRPTRAQVVAMVAAGMDSRQIADELGVSISRVANIRRQEGCPDRRWAS